MTLTTALHPDELRVEQGRTLETQRRRYGLAAKALFAAMDLVYGRASSVEKFRVLEVVARVPYQAWEHVAYIAVTHTHEHPNVARGIHDRVVEAREEQDNEQWHLLILEEMLHERGHRHGLVRGRIVPQVLAFAYYQLSWLLYVIRPRWSYRLNADFEDHAEHTYMEWVADNPELDETPWDSDFTDDYGPHATVGDLFRQIGLDEREHKLRSPGQDGPRPLHNRRLLTSDCARSRPTAPEHGTERADTDDSGSRRCRDTRALLPFSADEGPDPVLGPPDDRLGPLHDEGTLEQSRMLEKDSDDGVGITDEVIGVQLQLLEVRVLAHQVLDRVLEPRHERLQRRPVRRLLHVENDVDVDTHLLGDRQGVLGRRSVGVVVDRDLGHGRRD